MEANDCGLWLDCTPYLLQLGLTKSKTSLVWIAGPLSGLIIQPLIGVIADRSRSKYGRRRPFMIFGSFVVAFCLIILGWTAEIVGKFVNDPEKVCAGRRLRCFDGCRELTGWFSSRPKMSRLHWRSRVSMLWTFLSTWVSSTAAPT